MVRRVIIDTDPGIDDFLAILLALRSPELKVEALTTVGGNAPLRHTTRNALRTLEYAGRTDVPVAVGASRPLGPPRGSGERRTRRRGFRYAPRFHGATGLTARLPSPCITPVETDAVRFLAERLSEPDAAGPVTLIALGPLTNVAALLRRNPDALARSGGLIVMGGAVHRRGNVTPFAEFNVWNDPEAARTVFASRANITLVGLDVCEQVRATRADAARAEPFVRRMLVNWFDARPAGDSLALCDPLTVAAAIHPDLLSLRPMRLAVDTTHGATQGRTEPLTPSSGPARPTRVALAVDPRRAHAFIAGRVFAHSPAVR